MSNEYYDPSTSFVTDRFISYVRPLIGGPLPRLGRASLHQARWVLLVPVRERLVGAGHG